MDLSATQALEQVLLDGPAAQPPPGQVSDFDSKEDLSFLIIPSITTTLCLSTFALAIRIYTRCFILRSMSWDDYAAIVGWALLIGFSVPYAYADRYAGRHPWDTRLKDLFSLLYYVNIAEILYWPAILAIKFSILLQYLWIFVPTRAPNKRLYVMICLIIASTFILYTSQMFVTIFTCTPRDMVWNKLITYGHCVDTSALEIVSGVYNIVSDFMILLLPQHSIWKLKISTKQKLRISVVFAVGLLACVASICRLVWTIIVLQGGDITWNAVPLGLSGAAELAIGLICSCLPTLPKFLQTIIPRLCQLSVLGYFKSKNTLKAVDTKDTSPTEKEGQRTWESSYNLHRHHSGRSQQPDAWEINPSYVGTNVDIAGMDPREQNNHDQYLEEGRILKMVHIKVS